MNREEILDKAKEIVTGQREQDYGHLENSFNDIAALWTAYKNVDFSPKDVAIMMALLKIARIKTGHDVEDSYVDACGYMALAGEIRSNSLNSVDRSMRVHMVDSHGNSTGTYFEATGICRLCKNKIACCATCPDIDAEGKIIACGDYEEETNNENVEER